MYNSTEIQKVQGRIYSEKIREVQNIAVCGDVAMHRPRDGGIYKGRFWPMAW
jgi:hypothetical protein